MSNERGFRKATVTFLVAGIALVLGGCGQGPAEPPASAVTEPVPSTSLSSTATSSPTAATATLAPVAADPTATGFGCGSSLPVFPTTIGGLFADDYLGTPGAVAGSPPVGSNQLVAHWRPVEGVTTEIRWPAEPLPGAGGPYLGHKESIRIGDAVPHGSGHIVVAEVALDDDPTDPCAWVAVVALGAIPDQLHDEIRGFVEGLAPIDSLDSFLAALVDRPALADCPAAPPRAPGPDEVRVFVTCGELMALPLFPVIRPIPVGASALETALLGLVRGTTKEEQQLLLGSGFDWVDPAVAARIEVAASVDGDGVATVDFTLNGRHWDPGPLASTSHQLISFDDPFFATVFQFDHIRALDLADHCWGERGCGYLMTRANWLAMNFPNRYVRVDRDCDLADAWTVAECWLRSTAADPTGPGRVINVAQGDTLNTRVGPGTGFPRIEQLTPGTHVAATNITATADDGAAWRVIHTPGGHPGWVNDTYIELVDQ